MELSIGSKVHGALLCFISWSKSGFSNSLSIWLRWNIVLVSTINV